MHIVACLYPIYARMILTLSPLISEEEMDEMMLGNESDAEPISTYMLEYICDRSQYHPSINRIEARYNMHDHIKENRE